jgi:hypothetical protein
MFHNDISSVHQDITVLHISIPNSITSKYMKQKNDRIDRRNNQIHNYIRDLNMIKNK